MNDGSSVPILPTGVTAFVGPNNAGKSRLLREIHSTINDNTPTVVISGVEIHREGSEDDVLDWFTSIASRGYQSGIEHFFLEGHGLQVKSTN